MSLANATERKRAKQGLQCPECWSLHTANVPDNKFVCIACGEQWDKRYFGEDEQEDGI